MPAHWQMSGPLPDDSDQCPEVVDLPEDARQDAAGSGSSPTPPGQDATQCGQGVVVGDEQIDPSLAARERGASSETRQQGFSDVGIDPPG